MPNIEIPNVRENSTVLLRVALKDNGVAVDWVGLENVRAFFYSDIQRVIAGKCEVAVGGQDSTVLDVIYPATQPQYLGVNSLVVQCKYHGRDKTYDVPVLNFVERTAQANGVTTLEDPELSVEIDVNEVSTSLLDGAIAAALNAAEKAEEAAALVPLQVLEDCVEATENAETATAAANEAAEAANAAGITSVQASVADNEPGTPSVEASLLNKVLSLVFHHLKGLKGDPGATPNITVGTVSTGAPGTPVVITMTGTAAAPVLNITIPQGLKGEKGDQGNTGSSVEFPYELVNNLTTNDATKGLSAAQGVVLDGKISQLSQKVDDVVIGMGNLVVSLFKKAAYLSDDAEADITALENLLSGSIARIEATYTQSGKIYEGEPLDDLKSGLVVTAYYLDGTSDIVTGYTLSGTLAAGTSAITVSFGGATTTFNVTVTDAVWYITSEKFAKGVAVRSNITSASLNTGATINGVQYNFTDSIGNAPKRCVYYLFDLLWDAGATYKLEIYMSGKTANQTIFMGLQSYDETFRQAGVANVKQVCDYLSHMVDSGWLTPTENNGVLETTYVAPSSPVVTVGTRMAFKVQVSSTDQNWPSSLTIEKIAIRKIS